MEYIFEKKVNDESTLGYHIEKIVAKPERWVWGAIYKDGSELKQFGDDGKFHQVGEIVQENLSMMILYKFDDPTKSVVIPWRDGMRLIHKYVNIHAGGQMDDINETARIYQFGYKIDEQFSFYYILPGDQVVLSPREDIDFSSFKLR